MGKNGDGTRRAPTLSELRRWEVRGGGWEIFHVAVFYSAVINAVLATAGVLRLYTGIASAILLFYSMLAIFSSPTFAALEPGKSLMIERYRFFLPVRRSIPSERLSRIVVEETIVSPLFSGKRSQQLYLARIWLEEKGGKRHRVFRTHLNGTPQKNREEVFLVLELLVEGLGLSVLHLRKERGFMRIGKRRGVP